MSQSIVGLRCWLRPMLASTMLVVAFACGGDESKASKNDSEEAAGAGSERSTASTPSKSNSSKSGTSSSNASKAAGMADAGRADNSAGGAGGADKSSGGADKSAGGAGGADRSAGGADKSAGGKPASGAAGMQANEEDAGVTGSGSSQVACGNKAYEPVFKDPAFDYTKIYTDVDEWRDAPVRHRYVHGGIKDSDLRFSFYFPPKEQYQGRFFQYILPVTGNEHTVEMPEYPQPSYSVGFAADSGAYLVESNGGKLDFLPASDPSISLWKGSAATAEASRILANQMYCPHRPYGYAWGGSGGAFKTIACIENTKGVWDGVVPTIHATPVALPNNFTVQAHALRLLKDKLPGIIDAVEPGGSGDMYAGLNDDQRAALTEVTKFGFPPRAWFNYQKIAFGYTGVLASLFDTVLLLDPTYFRTDFWNTPGYLGHDHPESFDGQRIINFRTTVKQVLSADQLRALNVPVSLSASQPENASIPAGYSMTELPAMDLQGASITFTSGAAAGSTIYAAGLFGDTISIGYGTGFQALAQVAPGDQVTIDNSNYLAIQTYHRHQTAPSEYYVYDQYRDKNGQPLYPQRSVQVGTLFNQSGDMTGKFDAKMIVTVNLMDEIAFPWPGDWYRARVKAAQPDRFDDVYRLYFVDHAMHTPPIVGRDDPRPTLNTYTIDYGRVLEQALRDLAAWAERGVAPPASTVYSVADGQVQVPANAVDRKGLQPVVTAAANGGARTQVRVGEAVKLTMAADTVEGTGSIVGVEWDFEGAGDFPAAMPLSDTTSHHVALETSHTYSKAGTYFPAVRVSAHRTGNADTPYARIQNLARVRVVVQDN